MEGGGEYCCGGGAVIERMRMSIKTKGGGRIMNLKGYKVQTA